MRLEDMDVLEKAAQLEALIAKANLEPDYSIQVSWLGNQNDSKREARALIDNTRLLFQQGKIKSLDMDMRNEAYSNYNSRLASFLKMFPEYVQSDIKTESIAQRHM